MTSESRATRLTPLSAGDAAGGVIGRFATVLTALADEPAVIDGDTTLTYAQVADRAAAVRAALIADDDRSAPVAVLYGHRCDAVAAVLGVIASGRPLLVLDYRTPAPRLAQLCERVGASVVLADSDLTDLAASLGRRVISAADLTPASRDTLFAEGPDAVDPSAPAVLAFTSGSTGTPKVVLNNGHLLVSDAWRNSFATGCYGPDDVIAHTLPMAFHAGLMVTVAGLMVGSTMRLFDTRVRGIAGLAPWIESVGATVMHTSPAILRAFVGTRPTPEQLRSLTSVTIAGEPAHGRDVELLRPLLPPTCVLRNRYGSSETGLIAEYAIDADHPPLTGPLPVGLPVGETELHCVADDGTPVAEGESGIVVVTRDHTASGYRDNPEATAAAFSVEPDGRHTYRTSDIGRLDDGRLTLMGRRDHSVKIRGYMVEPAEVDAALFALPDVVEALTVGVRHENGDRYRLVSYVVSRADRPAAAPIRSVLRERLPGHLVPEAIVLLEALPRTERGKLDRAALPAPPPIDLGEEPLSEWERLVAQVWARALGLEQVGRNADFFTLGGDSLAAEELTAMIVSDLGVDASQVNSSMLTQAPTVAEYAARLHRRPDRRNQILCRLREGGDRPPLFLVAGGGGLGVGFVPVVRHLPEDLPVYSFHSHGLDRPAIPDWSIPAAARRNIRMMRQIQPQGPYHLGGHSFGGLVALEMAQQLRAAGDEVAILMVLDSFPPNPALIPPLRADDSSFYRRCRDLVGVLAAGIVPSSGHKQFGRFHAQSWYLSMRYRTTPYPGRTLVVVADSGDKAVRSAWAPHLSGEWTQVTTPGNHLSMMRDPNAAVVAQRILAALPSSESSASTRPTAGIEHAGSVA